MIQVNDISLSFPTMNKPALKNITFSVEQGSCTCLVGPSGSGKTSLLRIIAGLQDADSGFVSMQGRDITNIPAEERDIVMVFQSDFLFPFLSIERNIAFGLNFRSISKEEKDQAVKTMLEFVQLPDVGQRMPHQLSAGQRQRIALARSLVLKPRVLLLDEPLSNLDPDLQQSMRELLLSVKKSFDITMLCVTHSLEDILLLADTVGFLSEGRLVQSGDQRELFEYPRVAEVAMFFGNSNFLPASYDKHAIRCMQSIIPAEHWPKHWPQPWDFEDGSKVLLSCRPEHAVIRPRGAKDARGDQDTAYYDPERGLFIQACIEHQAYSPGGMQYYLRVGSSTWNIQHKDKNTGRPLDGQVEIEIPKEHLWMMPNTVQ